MSNFDSGYIVPIDLPLLAEELTNYDVVNQTYKKRWYEFLVGYELANALSSRDNTVYDVSIPVQHKDESMNRREVLKGLLRGSFQMQDDLDYDLMLTQKIGTRELSLYGNVQITRCTENDSKSIIDTISRKTQTRRFDKDSILAVLVEKPQLINKEEWEIFHNSATKQEENIPFPEIYLLGNTSPEMNRTSVIELHPKFGDILTNEGNTSLNKTSDARG